MIEVHDVHVQFREVEALAGVSLSVVEGETVHLTGHNGSGKSTLLRLVAGLDLPDTGSVTLAGRDATSRAARTMRSYTPDTPHLYDYLSARETATLAARLWGTPASAAIAAVKRVGLGDSLDTLVREMSLGMRKKLGLAVTTLHSPAVVLLDEPFSGLDGAAVENLRDTIRGWRSTGATILVTSHDDSPLVGLADRRVGIDRGRVVVPGQAAPHEPAPHPDAPVASPAHGHQS